MPGVPSVVSSVLSCEKPLGRSLACRIAAFNCASSAWSLAGTPADDESALLGVALAAPAARAGVAVALRAAAVLAAATAGVAVTTRVATAVAAALAEAAGALFAVLL